MNMRTGRHVSLHLWTILLLFVALMVLLASIPQVSAAQRSTRTPRPTRTSTPTNLDVALEIDLGDDFSPDLVADVGIGTGGSRPSVNCSIYIVDGIIQYEFNQQEVFDLPDYRVNLPSICSNTAFDGAAAFTPNGSRVNATLFTQPDFEETGQPVFVAAVPLGAFLTPGTWRVSVQSPAAVTLDITLPPLPGTMFFRGAAETGILAGFRPNEAVRVFAFTALNDDWQNRRFVKAFEFSVNSSGIRVLTIPGLKNLSFLFVGQQGSVYISNASYQNNGNNERDIPPDVVRKVWAALPGDGNTGGGSTTTGTERTDARGVVQVLVRAGCFQMGSDALGDLNNQIRGHSRRTVCITFDFWIDKVEVTNAQWEQFRVDTGSAFANAVDYNTSTAADTPRVGVTLAQAQAYAQWRGGWIPTEAQWEYAARGPQSPLYPWGNTFSGQANVAGMVGATVPVGSYPAGASWVGALDMAGNAGEWVSDCYDAGYDAAMEQDDPVGPCDGSSEMVKGSSFAFNATPAQSAYRFVNPPGRQWLDVGLRVASGVRN